MVNYPWHFGYWSVRSVPWREAGEAEDNTWVTDWLRRTQWQGSRMIVNWEYQRKDPFHCYVALLFYNVLVHNGPVLAVEWAFTPISIAYFYYEDIILDPVHLRPGWVSLFVALLWRGPQSRGTIKFAPFYYHADYIYGTIDWIMGLPGWYYLIYLTTWTIIYSRVRTNKYRTLQWMIRWSFSQLMLNE